jgi:hypothetical protein
MRKNPATPDAIGNFPPLQHAPAKILSSFFEVCGGIAVGPK